MVKNIIVKHRIYWGIILFLGFIYSGMTVGMAIILENAVNILVRQNIKKFVFLIGFTLIYIVIITVVFAMYKMAINKLLCRVISEIRINIFKHVINRSFVEFNKKDDSDYLSILTNDISILEDSLISPLISIWQNACLFILTFLLLLQYNYIVTIWLIFLLIVMMIFPNIIGMLMQKRQQKYSRDMGSFISNAKEFLSGHDVIRSFNVSKEFLNKFQIMNLLSVESRYKRDKLMVASDSLSCLLASILQVSILFIGGYLVIGGNVSLGILIALMQLCGLFTAPLNVILQSYSKIKSSGPIRQKIDECLTNRDDDNKVSEISPLQRITISNLDFRYPGTHQQILKDVDVSFRIGEKCMLLGESGSGKTTFVKLLSGYYKDYNGTIMYNNQELRALSYETVSCRVSIIHQNIFLFNCSIRDNITLFRDTNEQDINRVCSLSGINLFIHKLDKGLDTIVGERGKNISGGQRQRVAIARALLQNKEILILDEGTSSLDKETARDIENIILAIPKVTVITISHNFDSDSIDAYDKILLFHNSSVMQISKDELFQKNLHNKGS